MRAVRIILLVTFVASFVNCKGQNTGGDNHKKKNTTAVIDSVALKETDKKMQKRIIVYINGKTIKESIFLQIKGPKIKIFGQEFLISELKGGNLGWQHNYYFRIDTASMKANLFKEIYLMRDVDGGILAPGIDVTYHNYQPNYTVKTVNNYLSNLKKKSNQCDIPYKDIFKIAEFIHVVQITKNTVRTFNDIAYYSEKCEDGDYQAAYILEEIIFKFPNRTVAYINLGDAYWGLNNKHKAREAYQAYTQQMKAAGKTDKIPQRVIERLK